MCLSFPHPLRIYYWYEVGMLKVSALSTRRVDKRQYTVEVGTVKQGTYYCKVTDDFRLFGITGDWSTAVLDPGVYGIAQYSKGAIGLWPRG